jgi:heme exporter protein CcmD
MRRLIATATSALALLLLAGSEVLAAAPQGAGEAAGSGYERYAPPQAAASVSAPLYVVLAYSLIWLVLVAFVASVWRRQRQVEQELRQLEQRLGLK